MLGPDSEGRCLFRGQAIDGEFIVVDPVDTAEALAQVLEAEFPAAMSLAEPLEISEGSGSGCGVDVDEVSGRAAIGQSPDLGTDDVVDGEDRTVFGG